MRHLNSIRNFLNTRTRLLQTSFLRNTRIRQRQNSFARTLNTRFRRSNTTHITRHHYHLLHRQLVRTTILVITGIYDNTPLHNRQHTVIRRLRISHPVHSKSGINGTTVPVSRRPRYQHLRTASKRRTLVTQLTTRRNRRTTRIRPSRPVNTKTARYQIVRTRNFNTKFRHHRYLTSQNIIRYQRPRTTS